MLQVKNLTISFPGAPAPAVNNLSFTLEAGGRLGLLGLSGSGKSLTAMALLGLLPDAATITAGAAWYTRRDGVAIDLFAQNEKAWRQLRGQEISLVFQEPLTALNPVHRVRKQLLEAVRRHCPQLTDEAARMNHLRKWLHKVELGEDQDRLLAAFPHQLSGGQRQRHVDDASGRPCRHRGRGHHPWRSPARPRLYRFWPDCLWPCGAGWAVGGSAFQVAQEISGAPRPARLAKGP